MAMDMDAFRSLIRAEGTARYRDLPWRRTRDPYLIWLSEVMLQQTQVPRVEAHMPAWLERFPSVEALAAASAADVLDAWQGMGYNRRALALHTAAQRVVTEYDGVFPRETAALTALPGIGPATAQGIRSFAFDLPGVYLETNVRTVFLHHFFPDVPGVPDRELVPLIEAACPDAPAAARYAGAQGTVAGGGAPFSDAPNSQAAADPEDPAQEASPYATPQDADDTPRAWYYALLDYGAYLKKAIPNPSRRSAGYTRQGRFEGSRRQKRAEVVRILLAARDAAPDGLAAEDIAHDLDAFEASAGRPPADRALVSEILGALEREGFCVSSEDGRWHIA